MKNLNKDYLYLDDVAKLINKSWSFCQKEISTKKLISEKKYILGKKKYVILKDNLIKYAEDYPERIGTKNSLDNIFKKIYSFDKNSQDNSTSNCTNYKEEYIKILEQNLKEAKETIIEMKNEYKQRIKYLEEQNTILRDFMMKN